MSNDLQRTVADVRAGTGNLGYLLQDTSLAQRVDQLSGSIDQLMTEEVTPLLANLNQSGQEIATATQKINQMLETIDREPGLVNTLLRDTSVTRDFQETMDNINAGTERFNESMEALQHNFFFRGYFKKQARKARKEARATGQSTVTIQR
jgi:phospholipid/cholesterol/gamma-HCH transport system substrate-binding protein